MKLFLAFALGIFSSGLFAQEIFVLKKSYNPKNVLHFTAKVEGCTLKNINNHWIMGEQNGHIENLSSAEVSYFKPQISYKKETELDFTMGAIDKMGSRIEDNTIRVRLVKCIPKAYIDIDGQEIQLTEIYAAVGFMGLSVKSLTISGIGASGIKVSKTIKN